MNCGRAIRARAKQNAVGILLKLSGAVTLEVLSKASYGGIAWVGLALGFDHFHICCHIGINFRRGRKNLNPGFAREISL